MSPKTCRSSVWSLRPVNFMAASIARFPASISARPWLALTLGAMTTASSVKNPLTAAASPLTTASMYFTLSESTTRLNSAAVVELVELDAAVAAAGALVSARFAGCFELQAAQAPTARRREDIRIEHLG